MKLLFISQAHKPEDQGGFMRAFTRSPYIANGGEMRTIPFRGVIAEKGWNGLWKLIVDEARAFQPDIVFFQFFHGFDDNGVNPSECMNALRGLGSRPFVFASLGDQYDAKFPFVRLPNHVLMAIGREADAFFTTSLGRFAKYLVMNNIRNIVFLPHAFGDGFLMERKRGDERFSGLDVVMVGSCVPGLKLWSLRTLIKRRIAVNALWRRFGNRFAVFGRGWGHHPACRGEIAFGDQVRLFASCKVAVDAPAPADVELYASDRPFYIAGSGAALAMGRIKGFERIFKEGEHVFYYDGLKDIVTACEKALSLNDDEREKNRLKMLELVKTRNMIDNRVDTIFSVAEALLADDVRKIRPWHFQGELNPMTMEELGVVNWQGAR